MKLYYKIRNRAIDINISKKNKFIYGNDEVLSNKFTDPTFDQPWYNKGFKIYNLYGSQTFSLIKKNIKETLINILNTENINTLNFELDNYHHFVQNDEDHYKIISKTRDLFNNDFNASIIELHKGFENLLGFKLTNKNPDNDKILHIIIRIIRPFSNDYNPPHKDIYGSVDNKLMRTKMINFWIPICGLTKDTSLPIVPSSHLINENKILRTRKGGLMNDNKYRVRLIKSWGKSNNLIRPKMDYGDALVFSSHLIHGLSTNEQKNKTRMSLEFRLFKEE